MDPRAVQQALGDQSLADDIAMWSRFITETGMTMAANTFFDIGATGAEAMRDPAMFVRGATGNREQAAQLPRQGRATP
jgi:hypothetical protein